MRCAIYTRKSTDEGLDQEFNSLDAQREAASAYIHSQKHEGWTLLPDRYDDGGFTGANLNRPALIRLMQDIRDGKIDCVVVYKVDRLTRSLRDFVKLMADFEQQNATFVSVTQQFITTTSMGRLTLNILLSFAQFERELISERTRDKIAYSRRNGKWGGGRAPLGYRIEAGRLRPDPEAAEYIREVFAAYVSSRSLRRAARLINAQFPLRPSITPARVQNILRNPIYMGKIRHHGVQYDGEHDALIDLETWNQVQEMLDTNCVNRSRRRQQNNSLLHELLVCGFCGSPMQNSTTTKNQVTYRFYTCQTANRNGSELCAGQTVPAAALESFVLRQLQRMIKSNGDEPGLVEYALGEIPSKIAAESAIHDWNRFSPAQKRLVCELLILEIKYSGFEGTIEVRFREDADRWRGASDGESCSIPFHFKTGRHGKKRLIFGPPPIIPPLSQRRIPLASRLLAQAIHLDELRRSGIIRNQSEMASQGAVTRARLSQIMNLLNLASTIQEEILFWPRVPSGRDPFVMRDLLPICMEPDWEIQLRLWQELLARRSHASARGQCKQAE